MHRHLTFVIEYTMLFIQFPLSFISKIIRRAGVSPAVIKNVERASRLRRVRTQARRLFYVLWVYQIVRKERIRFMAISDCKCLRNTNII